MTAREILCRALDEYCGIDKSLVRDEVKLRDDLQIGPTGIIMIGRCINVELGNPEISVSFSKINRCKTIGDLIALIELEMQKVRNL